MSSRPRRTPRRGSPRPRRAAAPRARARTVAPRSTAGVRLAVGGHDDEPSIVQPSSANPGASRASSASRTRARGGEARRALDPLGLGARAPARPASARRRRRKFGSWTRWQPLVRRPRAVAERLDSLGRPLVERVDERERAVELSHRRAARGWPSMPELGDVAAEEERDRPVGDDAQLPREQRQLVEVVRPRDEPAGEAAEPAAEHVGDALVAAERRDLAEHPVAVRLRLARRGSWRAAAPGAARAGRSAGRTRPASRGSGRARSRRAPRRRSWPSTRSSLVDDRRGRARRAAGRTRRAAGARLTPAVQTSVLVGIRSPSESTAACGSTASSVVDDADVDAAARELLARRSRRAARGISGRIFGAASTSTQRCGAPRSGG